MTYSPTRTAVPTMMQSDSLSLSPKLVPTSAPSLRYQNIAGNAGCPDSESLYEVIMYDAWGDGWDDTKLTITRMEREEGIAFHTDDLEKRTTTFSTDGSSTTIIKRRSVNNTENIVPLESPNPIFDEGFAMGSQDSRYLCLRPWRCYNAKIDRGKWPEEIMWEIRPVPLGI
uniref:Uncharacterized protein n=1 Tax=Eucampia antarctica TaxID=49252 RepID=A0A7S2SLG8_9STRA|mmetsp:Transcript_9598/g.9243  ORF Transcript_9598/g.9243 Transcript_9598/m.9243 type:complete len:171 (+) Transcript_9598:314-826(+)